MNEKEDLVEDDGEVDRTQEDDHASEEFESAMEADEDQAERDEGKFPDPESFPVELDDGLDNGIGLPTLQVEKPGEPANVTASL
jgi:hypothetical protein